MCSLSLKTFLLFFIFHWLKMQKNRRNILAALTVILKGTELKQAFLNQAGTLIMQPKLNLSPLLDLLSQWGVT